MAGLVIIIRGVRPSPMFEPGSLSNIIWHICDDRSCPVTVQRVALRLLADLGRPGSRSVAGSTELLVGRGTQAMPGLVMAALP